MSSSSRNRAIVRYDTNESEASSGDHSSKRRKNRPNDHSIDSDMNDESIDRIVNDCVKYLIIVDHKKTPVKRSDLLKAVVKQMPNRKTCDDIMSKVTTHLSQVFGIELVECPETANTYILVNRLSAQRLTQTIDSDSVSEQQFFKSGLLSVILALIFMSGQTVHEDQIWKFLDKLGFDSKSKTPSIRINDDSSTTIKKLLTELWVRQLYLKYQKIVGSEPTAHEFKWGFRAEKEFNKLDVIKLVCDVFADGSKPEFWRTQYAAAQQQHRPSTQSAPEVGDDVEIEMIEESD